MTEERPLKKQIQRFIEAYLVTWVGAEAARIAGYAWPEKAATRLMKDARVQAAITARLDEVAMPANEVLARLAQQARVNMGDFIDVVDCVDPKTGARYRDIAIKWDVVKSYGYLVKKISYSRQGKPQIELVDNQKALELLGKKHKLFADVVDLNAVASMKAYVGISPDDWDEQ